MKNFVTKHEVRDGTLWEELKKLRTVITHDLIRDDEVLAIFYGGSIARGNYDLYSDLDLRVVVTKEAYSDYLLNKKERAKAWGNISFFEDRGTDVPYSIAHYTNFLKVDTFYYTPEDLIPSVYFKEEAEIDYDPHELIKNIKKASQNLSYNLSYEELEIWRGKFLGYLHDTYRRVMRDETYYALQNIDWMRWSIVTGWYMEKGYLPNDPGSWSKYEGKRSKLEAWQQNLLESWDCNRDPLSIVNTYKLMIPEFKRLNHSLCKQLNIDDDIVTIEEITNAVL